MADEEINLTKESGEPPMPKVDSTLKSEKIETHRYRPLYRTTQIIWYVTGVIELLLLFRFFLKLFGANPEAGFTKFIYGASVVVAGPFFLVFGVSQSEGNVFEWSTLLAAITYVVLAWLIVKAVVMGKPVTTEEAEKKLPEQEKL